MNRRVTLKDIARAAGVHASTASRALDPNRETPISDDVVERVKRVAEQLGYRPNRVAYSLRTQKTMTIGVMIPDITNTIFPPIVRGIESIMEPAGYASIIVNTDGQTERERRLAEILRERGVDGMIHTAALLDDPAIVEAARDGLPIVTLNRKIDDAFIPSVINDEAGGIRAAFELLLGLGHQHIAHLAGPSGLSTGQLRREAFEALSLAAGLAQGALPVVEAVRFDEAEGRRRAREILESYPETTAILCANDLLAIGALEHLRSIGLECPRDVSLTGFNDMPFIDRIPPGLTTLRIQKFEAGRVAAEHLLSMMCGGTDGVPLETVLPVELVQRGSVAPPRRHSLPR